MKVLYAAYRHDPRLPDLASGSDYNFYRALQLNGMDVDLLGPFNNEPILPERVIRRLYSKLSKQRYAKFPLSLTWYVSNKLNKYDRVSKPDVIFTIFPNFLTFYSGNTPCVYRLDTSFAGWQQNYPEFGKLALKMLLWQEHQAFRRVAAFITQSDWSKQILIDSYGVEPDKVHVFPNPSALPSEVMPSEIDISASKKLEGPLRLLLVGRDYHRKGIDIAIEVVSQLNSSGIEANLTVCGVQKPSDNPHVKFVGPYKKSVPEELDAYVRLYKEAHLLLHPAIFEAAGIVPSEAAAFGTPTITNDAGGLGTTVKHNVSGIVLPKGSLAEVYTQAIKNLIHNPEQYYALCFTTRKRYEQVLNWEAAGKQVVDIIKDVVSNNVRV